MLEYKDVQPGYVVHYLNENFVIKQGTVIGLACNPEFSNELCVKVRSDGHEAEFKIDVLSRTKEDAINEAVKRYKEKLVAAHSAENSLKVIHNLENIIIFIESQR